MKCASRPASAFPMAALPAFLASCLVWILSGCGEMPWEEASGGSATETTGGAKVTGRILYPDNSPAAGAALIVRPAEYVRDSSNASDSVFHAEAVVGKDGSYAFDSIPSGDYVLEIRDSKGNASVTEFRKDAETGKLARKPDTLRKEGALYGNLGSIDGAPGEGFVQIFGLGRGVRADGNGNYRFSGLPSGRLKLRALSSKPSWRYRDTVSASVLPGDSTQVREFVAAFDEDYKAWGSAHPRSAHARH